MLALRTGVSKLRRAGNLTEPMDNLGVRSRGVFPQCFRAPRTGRVPSLVVPGGQQEKEVTPLLEVQRTRFKRERQEKQLCCIASL